MVDKTKKPKVEKHWIMTVARINTSQLNEDQWDDSIAKQPIEKKWRKRYDYPALKLEFFQSEFDEVDSFMNHKGLTTKINRKDTKGWTQDKKKFKQKIVEKALEKTLKNKAKELSAKIDVDKLIRMKNEFFDTIDLAISQMKESERINMQDVIKWLNAIKTELGETTQINQNKNETEITWVNIKITWV